MRKKIICTVILILILLFGIVGLYLFRDDDTNFGGETTDNTKMEYLKIHRNYLAQFQVVDRNPSEVLYNSAGEEVDHIDVIMIEYYRRIFESETWENDSIDIYIKEKKVYHLIVDEESKCFFDKYDKFIMRMNRNMVIKRKVIDGLLEYLSDESDAITVDYWTLLAVDNEKIVLDSDYNNNGKSLLNYNKLKIINPKLSNGMEMNEFLKWVECMYNIKKREDLLNYE